MTKPDYEEVMVFLDDLPNYAVSNYGYVLNVATGRILKNAPDSRGYLRVALYHKGIRHDVLVHRLIASVFLDDYTEGVEVRHIDRDKNNCAYHNLEMGTGCRSR